MAGWKWVLLVLLGGYAGLVALRYVAQRRLMYFPEAIHTSPAEAGFPQAEEVVLNSADGVRVIVWHVAPRDERLVWLYFHGNGGALRYRVDRFRELTAQGDGLVALSYRGYGGSTGRPSETGLIEDARATYDFAAKHYSSEKIRLWGESLGTGVAIALAAERPVARIVLEAPFLSALDIAAGAYPFVPVRFLMKDQFRSDLLIAKVTAPVLILHGDRDQVVPISSGQQLYKLIRSPKRFVRIPGGGHENLSSFGIAEAVQKFLEEPFE
jgi:pimeloyl-ACP methyl ester carboxylesterase